MKEIDSLISDFHEGNRFLLISVSLRYSYSSVYWTFWPIIEKQDNTCSSSRVSSTVYKVVQSDTRVWSILLAWIYPSVNHYHHSLLESKTSAGSNILSVALILGWLSSDLPRLVIRKQANTIAYLQLVN